MEEFNLNKNESYAIEILFKKILLHKHYFSLLTK